MSIASLISSPSPTTQPPANCHVWIGLDFGTATTKCVVGIEQNNRTEPLVVAFGGNNRQDAELVIPSAVQVQNQQCFRTGLDLQPGGQISEGLKVKLLKEILDGHPNNIRRPDSPFYFALLHLASVLAFTARALSKYFRNQGLHSAAYYLGIAAPIGMCGRPADVPAGAPGQCHRRGCSVTNQACDSDRRVEDVFHELAYRSLVLSSSYPVGNVDKQQADGLYRQALKADVPVRDQSPVTVVPEALAAVVAFLLKDSRQSGNFATVDIGGGSTDVSFFWFQNGVESPPNKQAWYYSILSRPYGMSHLYETLGAGLQSKTGWNPNGLTSHQRAAGVSLHQAVGDPAFQVIDQFKEAYRRGFGEAFKVSPALSKHWIRDGGSSEWDLLMLGGGCSDSLIQEKLTERGMPYDQIQQHKSAKSLEVPNHLPILMPDGRRLLRPDGHQSDALRKLNHLLCVAYGLSTRAPDIPKHGQLQAAAPPPRPPAWQPPANTLNWGFADGAVVSNNSRQGPVSPETPVALPPPLGRAKRR